MTKTAQFRFYEELNDFLPRRNRKVEFDYAFEGSPSIKDAIEAIGVPHVEVDLILVGGLSVSFSYRLKDRDRVSVYPVFESLDVSSVTRLRTKPLRSPRFILDVHLGKLARSLRMLGFDALYRRDYDDPEIVEIAAAERLIILTRDVPLLKIGAVTRGFWIRSTSPPDQLVDVVRRFDLGPLIRPFTRCMTCNGMLREVPRESVAKRIPPGPRQRHDRFSLCTGCGKIYWPGTHLTRMKEVLNRLRIRSHEPSGGEEARAERRERRVRKPRVTR
jgi:uncharacterized protein with PIN domain